MKGFDYSSDNLYFVTICVRDGLCCFGEVVNENEEEMLLEDVIKSHSDASYFKMKLNAFGSIVKDRILWLEEQYAYVRIHNFVVMPNHVHLILEINRTGVSKAIKIKPLSGLVGAFKTTSSKLIHLEGFVDFSWHRSFHDRIIRTKQAYRNIFNYIDKNPQWWHLDAMYSKS